MNQRSRSARRIREEVARILTTYWGPTGTSDALARAACDSHVGPLVKALAAGSEEAKISKLLGALEWRLGRRGTLARKRATVRKLCRIDTTREGATDGRDASPPEAADV